MQRRFFLLTPLASALVATGCASLQQPSLAPANWDDFNRAQIQGLIDSLGKNSSGYNAAKPPYVVFDWDNTSVFLDIEEAALIYQLENLTFGATPAQLEERLREGLQQRCRPASQHRPDRARHRGKLQLALRQP